MMLRQLLTLLAVFTGLTAAVEPARALDAGVARVELAQQQRKCATLMVSQAVLSMTEADSKADAPAPRPRPMAAPCPPAVMLQADRALE